MANERPESEAGVNFRGDDLRICKSQIKIKEKLALGISALYSISLVKPNLNSSEIKLMATHN